MAKSDIYKGRYRLKRNKKMEIIFRYYERENKNKEATRPRRIGIKQQAINTYNERGNKEDAYKIVEIFNQKIGKDIYTKDIVDKWIEEYKYTVKQKEDDDAR